MSRYLFFCVALCWVVGISAQTYVYAERDTLLRLDVYHPSSSVDNGYTVIHIFGGGFAAGARDTKWDADYCRQLASAGYTAVGIDYRLGLRGATHVGLNTIELLQRAIYMAAEDCAEAVAWLCRNAASVGVDTRKIILEGSSAGAITALMVDYGRCNGLGYAAALPNDWKPAGVVAYSGAIFSRNGKPRWQNDKPAPTLLFHGTVDKIVPYRKTQFFSTGVFGANAIAAQMKKYNLPYCIYRYPDLGHEVSIGGPVTIDELGMFVRQMLTEGKPLHTDITQTNDSIRPSAYSKMTLKQLYAPK